MDLRTLLSNAGRRKLVDLRFRPFLQLKLPALLITITAAFCLLFVAHTQAAYGAVARIGLEEPWLRAFADEIRGDYLVVSIAIATAYVFVLLGACLAGTHRLLGPVGVLQRHLAELKSGNYTRRIQLRAGHPLADLARELNELSERLQRDPSNATAAIQALPSRERGGSEDRVSQDTDVAIDRLIEVYSLDRAKESKETPRLATAG